MKAYFLPLIVVVAGLAEGRIDPDLLKPRAPSEYQNCNCQCDDYYWLWRGRYVMGRCQRYV